MKTQKNFTTPTVNSEIMNKQIIQMPPNVRYMTEAEGRNIIYKHLPFNGKYILDKTLTGCGGTELFINSARPLVLISPRSGMLINKAKQHPECHLFRTFKKENLDELKKRLRYYLDSNHYISGLGGHPPKILVTLDSAKYVIDELQFRGNIENYLFLVDEFQCLIGDAAFKGKTELEFLKMLDKSASNICYMSATPIDSTYLEALPEFSNCAYYKLNWDPNVIVEPTVNKIQMRKGETPETIFSEVIRNFRRDGYFAKKIINGMDYYSKEAVVFVNEVRTIMKIIAKNNLKPDETTILISQSHDAVKKLEKMGFITEDQSTDRNNPKNKTFTFCSKASFEGRDFYSNNAFTYIFLDGTKDWETHDTSIEIPQMLGRQRLDDNPFKYNATIYYRTQSHVQTKAEFFTKLNEKMAESQTILDNYDNGNDILKKALSNTINNKDPNNPYNSNYLDVIHDKNGYRLEINFLVAAAEHTLWNNKAHFYNNPLHLTTAIQTQIAVVGTKSKELRDFEDYFNREQNLSQKLRTYTIFRRSHPEFTEALFQNPFIDFVYHNVFNQYGPDVLEQLGYDVDKISQKTMYDKIVNRCQSLFEVGKTYRADDVKATLQNIYDELGYKRNATASQIHEYMNVKTPNKRMDDGSRQKVYEVI